MASTTLDTIITIISEGLTLALRSGKRISGRRNSKRKGPYVEACLAHRRKAGSLGTMPSEKGGALKEMR